MTYKNDSFYCSQPPPKSERVTDKVWRRLRRPYSSERGESSSKKPQQNEAEIQPQNEHENQPRNVPAKKNFAVPIDESENWAKDVVEFYTNGDAPFCYSRFIGDKLDKNFWGTLLGCHANPSLTETHVEAWTVRLMRIRQSKLLKNPGVKQSWSVLPPCFFEDIKELNYQEDTLDSVRRYFKSPYPPFWEVDTVYLPLWIGRGDWLLVSIDMRNMVLTQYWTDLRLRNEKKDIISHYMEVVPLLFGWFLERIKFWSRSCHRTKCDVTVGLVELNVPKCNGNIANSGVLVCMMMEKLVLNKPWPIEDDVEAGCVNYRRYMADILYYWRCVEGG